MTKSVSTEEIQQLRFFDNIDKTPEYRLVSPERFSENDRKMFNALISDGTFILHNINRNEQQFLLVELTLLARNHRK
jgi:hypothetical protein